tara:strand:- start:125 stop:760 length:636 start_codon:yes stop_codon:yes gene_type:complete
MDLKERIRIALGLNDEATETQEVQLMFEGKLADGTIIVSEADELAAGVVVNILSEDGVQTPMPEGTYSLEDGTTFSVDAEGVVLEVAEEVEAEEDEDDMKKDDEETYMSDNAELFAEVGSVVKELLEEVRKDISRISAELDELRGENLAKDENIAELQQENTNLEAQVKELGEAPAETPVKVSKFAKAFTTNDKPFAQMTRQEKYWYNLNK